MAMQSVVVTAEFHPKPHCLDAVLAAIRDVIPEVHKEHGCQLYAVHHTAEDSLFMIELWEGEASLRRHSEGETVRALNETIEPLLREPVRVVKMTPVPIGDETRGRIHAKSGFQS